MLSLKNPLTFTQDVTDASVNTCCKLKFVFLEKRLWFSGRQYFEIRWGFYIKLKVSWPRALLWCVSHRKHVVCLGESRLSQGNNTPRANVFPAGVANFGKAMYRSLERSTQDTRDGFFCTVPRPHFLGRALIWPGYFGEHVLGRFALLPSSLSKSAGLVFLSGKASLVSISAAIRLLRSRNVYFLLEFEFGGKSCVDWEHGSEKGISCPLPCIRWSNKDNNN